MEPRTSRALSPINIFFDYHTLFFLSLSSVVLFLICIISVRMAFRHLVADRDAHFFNEFEGIPTPAAVAGGGGGPPLPSPTPPTPRSTPTPSPKKPSSSSAAAARTEKKRTAVTHEFAAAVIGHTSNILDAWHTHTKAMASLDGKASNIPDQSSEKLLLTTQLALVANNHLRGTANVTEQLMNLSSTLRHPSSITYLCIHRGRYFANIGKYREARMDFDQARNYALDATTLTEIDALIAGLPAQFRGTSVYDAAAYACYDDEEEAKAAAATAAAKPAKSVTAEDYICVACMDKPRVVVMMPCRHLAVCESCLAPTVSVKNRCPLCRTPIKGTLTIINA